MDDDARVSGPVKAALGAVGLGAVASYFVIGGKVGIIVGVSILVLALLCFGGYFLWRRYQARRQSQRFTAALEAQTAAAPRAISDPNKRAALDKLRQKFQTGLAQFKTRDKDIYRLPWHIIIGEPGSGKSEAIRHSGIDFPPGMQDELQGSGGTVNMDWWFTNRGIILDTAGSMIFNEAGAGDAPEWKEFLRLLKKTRPYCPVNGLFLVLSVESLIKDSADTIARKASRLAQQLDLIQRTLDVRFPVYLVVTKCDLLIGFREFFDSNDPDFQYQMFGWSNPDPLDAQFRPELVEQHLKTVAERLRRRRLALLRDTSTTGRLGDTQHFFASSYQLGKGAPATARRLDEVDSLFALPESVMRLAPRLRRYLETVFVAGEWSAKPVFLRGMYFTSSMREGKALDEAIALATGLPLDQLPEERSWEKNRAFFLRDLFMEKVFRESGLVTRATNTLKMLRQRQLLIFGSAATALLLLLGFATYGYFGLRKSVLNEADDWQAAAKDENWKQEEWSPGIIRSGEGADLFRFTYDGTNHVEVADHPTVLEYHSRLKDRIEGEFSVPLIFKPAVWVNMGKVGKRDDAQRILFERGVLLPVVKAARQKMREVVPPQTPMALKRHREALLSLVQLEADKLTKGSRDGLSGGTNATERAGKYLNTFLSYLTDSEFKADTKLINVFSWTYVTNDSGRKAWPPAILSGGDRLSNNPAIKIGLERFRDANRTNEVLIQKDLANVNQLVIALGRYRDGENHWLQSSQDACGALKGELQALKVSVDSAWNELETIKVFAVGPLTNLNARYQSLETAAQGASQDSMRELRSGLGVGAQTGGIVGDVLAILSSFSGEAVQAVRTNRAASVAEVNELDKNLITPVHGRPAFESRWSLYSKACDLREATVGVSRSSIGSEWKQLLELQANADSFVNGLTNYSGPLDDDAKSRCDNIAGVAVRELRINFISGYLRQVSPDLETLTQNTRWTINEITNARSLFERIQLDLNARDKLGPEKQLLTALPEKLIEAKQAVLNSTANAIDRQVGFPVRLQAQQPLDLNGLKSLRALLDGLGTELDGQIWKKDGGDALNRLQENSRRYASVLTNLVNKDGELCSWNLELLVPDNATNNRLLSVFPKVAVAIGVVDPNWKQANSVWKNSIQSTEKIPLGSGPVNAPLEICFRKFYKVAEGEVSDKWLPDWGLMRAIRDGNCERLDGGKRWRLKIKLEDKPLSGYAVFDAQISDTFGLPKIEDWPK